MNHASPGTDLERRFEQFCGYAWVLRDWVDFGPATAVQTLDDPGIPEHPGDSQH